MLNTTDQSLLEVLLDSWDRNNTVLLGLPRALPEGGLGCRAMQGSPTVAQMLTHVHVVRLYAVAENVPESARALPEQEWQDEPDPERIEQLLRDSAGAVRDAVKGRVQAGRGTDLHYDHPALLLQHLIWHEGYHHGQIKLALKVTGRPVEDEEAGPATWDVWMKKRSVI